MSITTGKGTKGVSRNAVTLRPKTDADYPFLCSLYHSVREEEMKHFPFDDAQRRAFLDMQFAAQSKHYAEHYPTATFDVIEVEGEPVGRFYVDEWPTQFRLVDISLVPEWRGAGIGSMLLFELMERARSVAKRVTIHVEGFNPALSLYKRLGFRHVDTNGVYFLMEWRPENYVE